VLAESDQLKRHGAKMVLNMIPTATLTGWVTLGGNRMSNVMTRNTNLPARHAHFDGRAALDHTKAEFS